VQSVYVFGPLRIEGLTDKFKNVRPCVPAAHVQTQSAKKNDSGLELRTTQNISPKITQNNFPNHSGGRAGKGRLLSKRCLQQAEARAQPSPAVPFGRGFRGQGRVRAFEVVAGSGGAEFGLLQGHKMFRASVVRERLPGGEGEPKSPSENESDLQRGSLNGSAGPKMNVFGSSMANHCVIPIDENYHLYSRLDRHTEP
jgi:hypothetical protein